MLCPVPMFKDTYLFPKRQILDSSKLKEFADDNSKFEGNGRKFFKQVGNTVGKREIACKAFTADT